MQLNDRKINPRLCDTCLVIRLYMNIFVKYLLCFLVFILSGCSVSNVSRGSQISKDDLKLIEPKKDNISSVIEKFGAPMVVSPIVGYDGMFRYYYVSSLYKRVEPLLGRCISQYIIVVTFNKDGFVDSVCDSSGAMIQCSSKSTKSIGKYSFLSQIADSRFTVSGPGGAKVDLRGSKKHGSM